MSCDSRYLAKSAEFTHHNMSLKLPGFAARKVFSARVRFQSSSSLSYSHDIPTVPLSFDRYASPNKSTKSPLIILHGLFGSKSNNRTVAKKLSLQMSRDVYCVDLRNHGDSGHSTRHDYPALAADVEQFIANEKLHKPILIGHSMGAKTVMAVALRKPDLPKYVIPVDNAPIDYNYSSGLKFAQYVRGLLEITEKKTNAVVSRKAADAVLAQVEPELAVRQFVMTNLERKKKEELEKEFEENRDVYSDISKVPIFKSKVPLRDLGKAIDSGNIAIFPFDSRVSRYSGPTLFIRGTESPYISDEVIQAIGAFFPKFEIRDIKAGHWVISEQPDEFVRVVEDWIDLKDEEDDPASGSTIFQ